MSERPSDALGWDSDYWREPDDDALPDPEASVFGSPRPAPESYPPTQPDPYSQPQQPGYGASPGQRYVPAPPRSRQGYDTTAPQTQRYQPQYEQQQGYPSQYDQPQTQRYPQQYEQQTQGYPQQYDPYQQPQHEGYPPQHRQPQHQRPAQQRRSRPDPERRRERDHRSGGGFPLGLGALVGVVGLGCFLAALLVLPWFAVGSEDVGLSDLREGFTVAETDAAGLPGASPEEPSVGEGGVPTAGEVGEAVEDQARDAATEAAADTIDSGKSRYLEMYVDTLWVPVAVGVGLAVLFSTVLAPKSMALGMLLGFRRMAGAVTVLAALAHGAALWVVFTGSSADDPAFGVWLGIFGLVAVFVAGIIGPKRSS